MKEALIQPISNPTPKQIKAFRELSEKSKGCLTPIFTSNKSGKS